LFFFVIHTLAIGINTVLSWINFDEGI